MRFCLKTSKKFFHFTRVRAKPLHFHLEKVFFFSCFFFFTKILSFTLGFRRQFYQVFFPNPKINEYSCVFEYFSFLKMISFILWFSFWFIFCVSFMKKYQCSRAFYEFSDNNEHVISLVFFKFSEKKLILKERWFFICFVSISRFVKDFQFKFQKFLWKWKMNFKNELKKRSVTLCFWIFQRFSWIFLFEEISEFLRKKWILGPKSS